MNKQELIKEFKKIGIYNLNIFGSEIEGIPVKSAIALIEQLDEPKSGHADEAPRYVKNVLARLRELPLHDREVWLKAIMGEFEQDFSRAKWREGYEQGKFEGTYIPEKVKVPQCVHKYIQEAKEYKWDLQDLMKSIDDEDSEELQRWFYHECNQEILARAWLDGYEIQERKYVVRIIGITNYNSYLNYHKGEDKWTIESRVEIDAIRTKHTRKELEDANFGWVFDCEGIEIEEVTE